MQTIKISAEIQSIGTNVEIIHKEETWVQVNCRRVFVSVAKLFLLEITYMKF
jgi:hypothetical protein